MTWLSFCIIVVAVQLRSGDFLGGAKRACFL